MQTIMGKLICQKPECGQLATTHLLRVEQRQLLQESHYCHEHGESEFASARSGNRMKAQPTLVSRQDASVFDVAFVFSSDAPNGPWQVYLEEVGGLHGIGIDTGPFECAALIRKFRRSKNVRPLTHDAMATVITALGAKLQQVAIDKLHPGYFEAKLCIDYRGTGVAVDVRPSDAIIMAVTTETPIMVAGDVLSRLGHTRPDTR
jgi:uncharacterized protein